MPTNPKKFDPDKEHAKIVDTLRDQVGKVEERELPFMQNRIWRMIEYAIGRLDYYEEYRRRYMQIGLAAIGLAVTLLALVGRTYFSILVEDPQVLRNWYIAAPYIVVLLVVIGLAWAGFRQLYLYIAYTSPEYPYREVTGPDWFYRYVKARADEKNLLRVKFRGSEADKIIKERLQRTYLEELSSYGDRLMGRSSRESVINDIEQLMALHTLTQYKQAQASKMRGILWLDVRSLLAISAIAIIAMIIAA